MKVTILGCGRWASFHAWYQAKVLGNDVLVWGLDDAMFREISTTRKNEYITLPKQVQFTSNLQTAIDNAEYIIISISAQAMPQFSRDIAKCKPRKKTFVLCMKGIIDCTGERLSVVLRREIDKTNKITVWVGPGHVQDFTTGQPNIMLIDGCDPDAVIDVTTKFKSNLIRLYQGDDLLGAEVGAAAKNVLGIMAGMLDGAGMESLKGALMARGIYEVAKLIVAMGGKKITAYGISHLGDFQATLFSVNSHNRKYGEDYYKASQHHACTHVAEGVATAKAMHLLATKYKVEMPICKLCYEILHKGKNPNEGMKQLFERDNVKEFRF